MRFRQDKAATVHLNSYFSGGQRIALLLFLTKFEPGHIKDITLDYAEWYKRAESRE